MAGELRLAISVADAVMWREGYAPPLGRYLSCVRKEKATRAHVRPQKASAPGTLGSFPCKAATSGVPQWGPWVPIMDPPLAGTISRPGKPDVMVGAGHAPVVAVLLASARHADESIAAPKGLGSGPV